MEGIRWIALGLAVLPIIVGIANFSVEAAVVGAILGIAGGLIGLLFWPAGVVLWIFAWTASFMAVRKRDRRRDEERRHKEVLDAINRGKPPV